MPNVVVLSYTRSLTEFIKTGCVYQNKEIFPTSLVLTIEEWLRWLYRQHKESLPSREKNLIDWKRKLAEGAYEFKERNYLPQFDTIFVDEAQDLVEEEVKLLSKWGRVLFLVGDSRQKLYKQAEGLAAVRKYVSNLRERPLPFHYRLVPKICRMADRILVPQSGTNLADSAHYEGPQPGTIDLHGPLSRERQMAEAAEKLEKQIRVYADLIRQGDRLGVVVAQTDDREVVLDRLEKSNGLQGKVKIIRSKNENDTDYEPSFDPATPVCILSVAGCKGLEFRAVHWLFCEDLSHHYDNETYYTVVTRAKTSLDLYYSSALPQALARGYSENSKDRW